MSSLTTLQAADFLEYVARMGYTLIRVNESDQKVITALQALWQRVRRENESIPPVLIELTPGRSSSCTSVDFTDEPPVVAVNLMPGGEKITGPALLEWMLHQASHAVAPPATATEGRFHPEAFRVAASSLGLDVTRRSTGSTGWSETGLARGTLTRYRPELDRAERAIVGWTPTYQAKTDRSSRNGISVQCQCSPPRKIRVSERTFDLGPVLCGICCQPFAVA